MRCDESRAADNKTKQKRTVELRSEIRSYAKHCFVENLTVRNRKFQLVEMRSK